MDTPELPSDLLKQVNNLASGDVARQAFFAEYVISTFYHLETMLSVQFDMLRRILLNQGGNPEETDEWLKADFAETYKVVSELMKGRIEQAKSHFPIPGK